MCVCPFVCVCFNFVFIIYQIGVYILESAFICFLDDEKIDTTLMSVQLA